MARPQSVPEPIPTPPLVLTMSSPDPTADPTAAIADARHRELATEHLLFHTLRYIEGKHPGLLDHLDQSLMRLGDSAHDDTKSDEAVREVARRFLQSLRRAGA